MTKGEIIQKLIDELIEYLDTIKKNISSIDDLLNNTSDEMEKVCLLNMKMVYSKVFDDISSKLKDTMEKLFNT